jgi:hypothetical protein
MARVSVADRSPTHQNHLLRSGIPGRSAPYLGICSYNPAYGSPTHRRRNAPLYNEQTRGTATTSPHLLRGRECGILPAGVNVVTVRPRQLSERLLAKSDRRSAQRASAVITVVSATVWLEIVGGRECLEGEPLCRVNQSVKAATTGCTQSRTRSSRAFSLVLAGPRVAGASNAQVP